MIGKTDKGIDWGNGQTNIDHATGIRYGVISVNECAQEWCDAAEPDDAPTCPKCGGDVKTSESDRGEWYCPTCRKWYDNDSVWSDYCSNYKLDDGEYLATSGESGDIFITKSPYYTACQFCSPCAPGAGYIANTVADGVKTYCFGHDWFENGMAPYPVYSVKTGELVEAIEVRG